MKVARETGLEAGSKFGEIQNLLAGRPGEIIF